MRRTLAPLFLALGTLAANAEGNTSAYTAFDLEKCRVIEPGDEYVYAGTWACDGYGGVDVIQSSADDRSFAAFGKDGAKHCSFAKTFSPFNTSLSPIEWRLKNGQPFAAIERWSVVSDENGNSVTWLVVNALLERDSCHVHYVSGSYPNANEQARRAADDLAEGFDCENDVPTVDSKVGAPPIEFTACRELPRE